MGKMWVDDAKDACGDVLGSMGDCGGPEPSAPAPAKTCGGMAWISVSSCCMRSSSVAARLGEAKEGCQHCSAGVVVRFKAQKCIEKRQCPLLRRQSRPHRVVETSGHSATNYLIPSKCERNSWHPR